MNPNINLNTISDLHILKSLAYDEIAAKERADKNLRAINDRIYQITIPQASKLPDKEIQR